MIRPYLVHFDRPLTIVETEIQFEVKSQVFFDSAGLVTACKVVSEKTADVKKNVIGN
ncbi:MAG: hypothetical protein HY731_06815 [Candidatus Tectomicrobia bacterium]|nr:hypothetical protein [Candidatus Tectomicrobia bacterium]